MRKLIAILLAVAIVTGSIGFHVIEHHCIWCGGDKIEFVAIGLPTEHTDSCCGEMPGSHQHDCHDDGCCDPGFLTIETGLVDEGGLSLLKTSFTIVDFTPVLVSSAMIPDLYYPGGHNIKIPSGPLYYPPCQAGVLALRC
jgi:hypothetical protein